MAGIYLDFANGTHDSYLEARRATERGRDEGKAGTYNQVTSNSCAI